MHDPSPRDEPFDKPGTAIAAQGVVILDGPAGVAVTLSPDAAEATARSLLKAAEAAREQGLWNDAAADG